MSRAEVKTGGKENPGTPSETNTYPTKSPGNKSSNFSGFRNKIVFPRGSQKV